MTVTCSTIHPESSKQVFLVLEELNNSNFSFWNKYLTVVKNSPQAKALKSGTASSSSSQMQTASTLSDLRVAADGFGNALELGDTPGMKQYVAYSTFDPESVSTNDNWK